MANFTPGPWKIIPLGRAQINWIVGDRGVVASGHTPSWMSSKEADANARLITAAPDLLATLNAAPLPSTMGNPSEHYERFYDWYHKAVLPVIAKAEGR